MTAGQTSFAKAEKVRGDSSLLASFPPSLKGV